MAYKLNLQIFTVVVVEVALAQGYFPFENFIDSILPLLAVKKAAFYLLHKMQMHAIFAHVFSPLIVTTVLASYLTLICLSPGKVRERVKFLRVSKCICIYKCYSNFSEPELALKHPTILWPAKTTRSLWLHKGQSSYVTHIGKI